MSSMLDNVPFITVDQSVLDKILEEIEEANKKVESINTANWNSDNATDTTIKQLDKVIGEIEQATKQIEKINSTNWNTSNTVTTTEDQPINSEQSTTPSAPKRKSSSNRRRANDNNKRRKRNVPDTVTTSTPLDEWTNWSVKPISDAPLVSWTDCNAGYQRTVQNPANYGPSLLKIQLFEGGVAKHVSAVYLIPDTEVYKLMNKLVSALENMWVDRDTGVTKVDGVIKSMMPLAAWRYSHPSVQTDCTKQDGGGSENVPAKRKRQADCTTQDGGSGSTGDRTVGSTVPAKRRRVRASV